MRTLQSVIFVQKCMHLSKIPKGEMNILSNHDLRPDKKQRIVKSKIWNFFTQDLDENTPECNICAKVYAFLQHFKGRNQCRMKPSQDHIFP